MVKLKSSENISQALGFEGNSLGLTHFSRQDETYSVLGSRYFLKSIVAVLTALLVVGLQPALASNSESDYQKRILLMMESARELEFDIRELDTDLRARKDDRLSIYLALDDEVSSGQRWRNVEVRLNGVLLRESLVDNGVSQSISRTQYQMSWSGYASSGKHSLEVIFTGMDATGKFVEVTQRKVLTKKAGSRQIHIVRSPSASKPVVGRSQVSSGENISVSIDPSIKGIK